MNAHMEISGYAQTKNPDDGAVGALDHELDQLEQRLDSLSATLAPVRSQYALTNAVLSEPRPEPATALRGRIDRLRNIRATLEQITSEIDL